MSYDVFISDSRRDTEIANLDSKLILMLASEHSYQSEYTRKELVFTVNNRGSGAIFPLIIDGKPLPRN